MPKIPRILLDKKTLSSITPIKGTLSFNTIDPDMICIISNLYRFFIDKNIEQHLFTLQMLFTVCCPNEPLFDSDGNKLHYKLTKFREKIIEYAKKLFSYPVQNDNGQLAIIAEHLYILKMITKRADEEVLEYFKITTNDDNRFKTLYGIRVSKDIKREFLKNTYIHKDRKKGEPKYTNYIESEVRKLDGSNGTRSTKIKKIQQVINEELSIKKLRIKKNQPVELSSEFEIEDFAMKMGDLKTLKANKTRYLDSLEKCFNSIVESVYPVTDYKLIDKKKLKIIYGIS
jgi:hypothetical protein